MDDATAKQCGELLVKSGLGAMTDAARDHLELAAIKESLDLTTVYMLLRIKQVDPLRQRQDPHERVQEGHPWCHSQKHLEAAHLLT
jgi:hypothetical protein